MKALSVVTIARDEERDLPGFLTHFCSWAAEVVVVDDGSKDRTTQIARAFGPKVLLIEMGRAPGENFAALRNRGIEAASGDWLLHTDVDMRATPELVAEVRRAIEDTTKDQYVVRLADHFLNRPRRFGGSQRLAHPWLVRRGLGRFEGRVHEKLITQVPRDRLGRLVAPIVHLGDDHFEERLHKNIAYSRLVIEQGGRPPSMLGGLVDAARVAATSYVLYQGFRDGRAGLLWALYQFSSTLNRHLWHYDRAHHAERAVLEAELASSLRAAGLLAEEP